AEPFWRAAMSTNSAVAYTVFFDALIVDRASSRSSATCATPMWVSVVEYEWGATTAAPPVSALKSADFPALGSPTSPNRSIARASVASTLHGSVRRARPHRVPPRPGVGTRAQGEGVRARPRTGAGDGARRVATAA